MRIRPLLVLAAAFAAAAAAAGPPPCTPLQVTPLPRPEGWEEPEYPHFFEVTAFDYAGGRYFLSAVVYPNDASPHPIASVIADSLDGKRFVPATVSPRREGDTMMGRAQFERGWYFRPFLSGCLGRSRDGFHWEFVPVCSGDLVNEVTWTGTQFVVTGSFGGVWTSPDGETWTPRTPVPGVYRPMHTGWADRYRLIVGGTELRGYTEDYKTWHIEYLDPDTTGIPGPSCINGENVGNGWLVCGPDRTRDGNTWLRLEGSLEYPFPPLYFGGREFFGWKYAEGPPTADLMRITFTLRTSPDGASWSIRQIQGELLGTAITEIIMPSPAAGWDGVRTWEVWHRGIAPEGGHWDEWSDFFVVSTTCADLGDPVVLPGVANAEGVPGSRWRTELALHYPGPNVSEALIEWLPFGRDNAEPVRRRVFLSTGESVSYRDVLGELFGVTGAGSLRVVSVGPEVVVHARTYNESGSGTYGQEIGGWRWEDGIGPDEEGWLLGLEETDSWSEGFRTNVGVQNLWQEPVTVEVVFRDREGRELGRRRVELGPFAGVQWSRPLADYAPEGIRDASALVRVVEGDSRVAAYASRVDNATGDPTTIRATVLPRQDTVPADLSERSPSRVTRRRPAP